MGGDLLLAILFGITAALYASVGQAGGTGYVAVMGLLGYGPEIIKPTALALNIVVAAIGCWRFARSGLLSWRQCWPFALLGVPFSVAGGATHLPPAFYHPVVGALLLLAAALMIRSVLSGKTSDADAPAAPPLAPSLAAGAAIGFLAGLTGIGGGVFLSPLVLALGWIGTRHASGVSATFNLVNSVAALAGVWATVPALPAALPWWFLAVAAGGLLGSWLGARYLPPRMLRTILAAILLLAGLRMVVH